MGNHKFLKAVTAAAAVGGVCYLFKDKIKESSIYQSMDVDDKVQKVKTTIKEKMPTKNEEDKDYFTLDDDEVTEAPTDAEETPVEEAPAEEIVTEEAPAEDAAEEAPVEEAVTEEAATEEAPAEEPSVEAPSEGTADITAMVDDLISDIPTIDFDNKDSEINE